MTTPVIIRFTCDAGESTSLTSHWHHWHVFHRNSSYFWQFLTSSKSQICHRSAAQVLNMPRRWEGTLTYQGPNSKTRFGSSFQCLGLWFIMVHSSSHITIITNLHCRHCQNSTCKSNLEKGFQKQPVSLGRNFTGGKSWNPSENLLHVRPSYRSCGISMAKTSKDHAGVGKGTTTCGRPSLDISSANSANRNMKGYCINL